MDSRPKTLLVICAFFLLPLASGAVEQFYDQCTSESAAPHMMQGFLYPPAEPWQCYHSSAIEFTYSPEDNAAYYSFLIEFDATNNRKHDVFVDGHRVLQDVSGTYGEDDIPLSLSIDGTFTISIRPAAGSGDNAAIRKIRVYNEDGRPHGEWCTDSRMCVQSEEDMCVDTDGDGDIDTCDYCSAYNGRACDMTKVFDVELGMCVQDYPTVSCESEDIAYVDGDYATCHDACGMGGNECGYDGEIPLCDSDVRSGGGVDWEPEGVCATDGDDDHACDDGEFCERRLSLTSFAIRADCSLCEEGDRCEPDGVGGLPTWPGLCVGGDCCTGDDECQSDEDCEDACLSVKLLMDGSCGACDCDYAESYDCGSLNVGETRECTGEDYCCYSEYSPLGDIYYRWDADPEGEEGERACADGVDNDCDGLIDCDDDGCGCEEDEQDDDEQDDDGADDGSDDGADGGDGGEAGDDAPAPGNATDDTPAAGNATDDAFDNLTDDGPADGQADAADATPADPPPAAPKSGLEGMTVVVVMAVAIGLLLVMVFVLLYSRSRKRA